MWGFRIGVEGKTTTIVTTTRRIYVVITSNNNSGLKDFNGLLMC
jgi:hypothetical protein